MHAGLPGQDLHRRRAGHQLAGDAQDRGGIQRLRDPEPTEKLDHPHRGREFVRLHGSPLAGSLFLVFAVVSGHRELAAQGGSVSGL